MTCFATLTDPQSVILAALIAAGVGALSWLGKSAVSAFVWFYERLSREREMLIALGAEIQTCIDSLEAYAKAETIERLKSELLARPDFKLFIPLDRDYFVFEQVKPDITKLPEAPIRQVVRFYDGMGGFDTLLAAMQEERFEAFPASQRATTIDYMQAAAGSIAKDGRAALEAIASERRSLRWRQMWSLLAMLAIALGAGKIAWNTAMWIAGTCAPP